MDGWIDGWMNHILPYIMSTCSSITSFITLPSPHFNFDLTEATKSQARSPDNHMTCTCTTYP